MKIPFMAYLGLLDSRILTQKKNNSQNLLKNGHFEVEKLYD